MSSDEQPIIPTPNYAIRRHAFGNFSTILLTVDEYEKLLEAKEGLREALDLEEKLDIIVGNFYEFEHELLTQTLKSLVSMDFKYAKMQTRRLEVNRAIMNLLTACRLYHDTKCSHASGIAKGDPTVADQINQYASKEYDNSFSYRFLEALRNYAQHSALPVANLSYHSSWKAANATATDHLEKDLRFGISIPITLDTFKGDSSFKKSVLEEAEGMPNLPDLRAMIREYLDGIRSIHSFVRKLTSSKVEQFGTLIIEKIDEYMAADTKKSDAGIAVVQLNADGTYKVCFHLFKDSITYWQELSRKNAMTGKFAQMYVSSQIWN